MKIFINIFVVSSFLFFQSCKKTNNLPNNPISPTGDTMSGIYVAGNEQVVNYYGTSTRIGKYWKNGKPVVLSNASSDLVYDIFVYKNIVYSCGTGISNFAFTSKAKYWINNIGYELPDGTVAKSIFVDSSGVYIVGHNGNLSGAQEPRLWVNGMIKADPITHYTQSRYNDVMVKNNHIYICGRLDIGSSTACIWKDFTPQKLSANGPSHFSEASVIAEYGNDMYVLWAESKSIKDSLPTVKIWKNGISTDFMDRTTESFSDMKVVGNDVYLAGTDKKTLLLNGLIKHVYQPKYWKNGVATNLSIPIDGYGIAGGIAVTSNNEIIVAGSTFTNTTNNVVIWKNGIRTNLNDGSSHAEGGAIFIR